MKPNERAGAVVGTNNAKLEVGSLPQLHNSPITSICNDDPLAVDMPHPMGRQADHFRDLRSTNDLAMFRRLKDESRNRRHIYHNQSLFPANSTS